MQEKVELIDTFRHMASRKLCRLRHGHAQKQSMQKTIWILLLVLLFLGMTGVLATKNLSNIPLQILVFLFVIVISYIIVKASLVFRWFLYWLVAAVLALVFVVDFQNFPADNYNPQTTWVLVGFVSLELLTFVGYLFWWYIYPQIVLLPYIDPQFWWQVKQEENDPYSYSFRCFDTKWLRRSKRQFTYSGQVDSVTGKPHGFGSWTDNSIAGEYLTGFWEDGIPVGPFRSNEYATGFSFRNLRVGFCRATEDYWSDWRYFPSRPKSGQVSYGVAGVECSLAGKFFLDLPKAQLLYDNADDMNELVELVDIQLPQDVASEVPQITITLDGDDLIVPGHFNDAQGTTLPRSKPNELIIRKVDGERQLEIEGWTKKRPEQKYEVLIFIPGFNCSLKVAVERIAQMLALNNFPSHILTYVFSWPAGRIITYSWALNIATSEETSEDLCTFINRLHATGRISCFHILTHSMGARLALNASLKFGNLFCESNAGPYDPRPRLATFTLFNPEADIDAFTQEHYSKVYEVCNMISLFVDESDEALKWAEVFSRERMLGRYATQYLRKQNRRKTEKEIYSSNSSPLSSSAETLTGSYQTESSSSSSPTSGSNGNDNNKSKKSRLRLGKPDMKFLSYDLDIMDMTQLDANVHDIRHCYFNINRLVLDDLRDIIVFQKRAKLRNNRLLQVDNNVYTYISAPTFIVNP